MDFFRLLKYSFFTFLFLLPLQTVFLLREPFVLGEKWQYGTIGVYVTDVLLVVMLGVALCTWLRSIKYKVSSIKYGRSEAVLVLFLLWAGLSVVWAGDQVLAFSFFMKSLLAAGVFFLARSFEEVSAKKVILVLMAAGIIQSGIGIGQFLFQQSVDSSILGTNAHEAWQAGSSVLKIDGGPASPSLGGRFLRAYGTFPHPNMLGGFLAVTLVFGIAYQVLCTARLKKNERTLLLIGSVIVLLGLILTFSRVAWLGSGFGIGTLFVWSFFSGDTRKLRPLFSGMFSKTFLVLIVAGLVFVTVLHEQVFPRFDGATIKHEGSVSERVQSFQDAGMVIGEGNILLGTGVGNFTAEVMRLEPERPVWSIQPAHNVFVLVFSELGLVGLLFFVLFLWSVLRNMKKQSAIFIVALFSLLPILLLDHWLWTSHFGLLLLFLLIGLAIRRERQS